MPSPAQHPWVLREAKQGALDAVVRVRDDDPADVWRWLQGMNPQKLLGVAIALAAMVPVDRPMSELLAWTDDYEEAV